MKLLLSDNLLLCGDGHGDAVVPREHSPAFLGGSLRLLDVLLDSDALPVENAFCYSTSYHLIGRWTWPFGL